MNLIITNLNGISESIVLTENNYYEIRFELEKKRCQIQYILSNYQKKGKLVYERNKIRNICLKDQEIENIKKARKSINDAIRVIKSIKPKQKVYII